MRRFASYCFDVTSKWPAPSSSVAAKVKVMQRANGCDPRGGVDPIPPRRHDGPGRLTRFLADGARHRDGRRGAKAACDRGYRRIDLSGTAHAAGPARPLRDLSQGPFHFQDGVFEGRLFGSSSP